MTFYPVPRLNIFRGWWVLLAIALATLFAGGSAHWAFTILIDPLTDEFGVSHSKLLGVVSVSGLVGSISSPLLGRTVDKHGARIVGTASLLALGLSLVLSSQVQALWQFYIVYGGGLGISMAGLLQVSAPAAAANWFLRKRGIAFASFSIAAAAAGMTFPLLTQAIVDWQDWRMVWLIFGLATLAIPTPIAWLAIRRKPEDVGQYPDGMTREAWEESQSAASRPEKEADEVSDVSWTLKEASKTAAFWLLNGGLILISFPSLAVLVVLHPYFTELGVASGTASRLVSAYALGVLLGAFAWGFLVQLSSARVLLVPYAALYGTSIALLAAFGEAPVAVLYLIMVYLGMTVIGGMQLGNQAWADFFGRRYIGSIIGAAHLLRVLPMIAAPLVAGVIHDSMDSYKYAFALFAIFCLTACVVFLLARRPQKRGLSAREPIGRQRATPI